MPSARTAWAIPTLFQPYYHEATGRTYTDGSSMVRNPINLAVSELKRVWPSKPGRSLPPDIIVSIGSGIQVNSAGMVRDFRSDGVEKIKKRLTIGVRQSIETGLDTVASTLACHQEWRSFLYAKATGRLQHNCHRLDMGLPNKPPPLDAVDAMDALWWNAKRYVSGDSTDQQTSTQLGPRPFPPYGMDSRYNTAPDHISAIAGRLLASVFYLDDILPVRMPPGEFESVVHCRLPPSKGAFALLGWCPEFRVREVPPEGGHLINAMSFVDPEKGFDETTLSARVRFRISEGPHTRYVEVWFKHRDKLRDGSEGRKIWVPIGGF